MKSETDWQGRVQVYTGNGKGKTTAAIGLSVRAAGAGLRVFFAQFIKGGEYSEIQALKRFDDRITVRQYGRGRFLRGKPSPEDVTLAQQGLAEIRRVIASGEYRVLVLDEANGAIRCGLFAAEDLLAILDAAPKDMEVVITGRNAHPAILARGDLVTEMRCVKHYFDAGVPARTGIEK